MLNPLMPILAQGEATGKPDAGGGMLPMILMFGLMYLVFYFLLIRPQKKQQEQHRRLLEDLKKNDEVQTSGGFFGKVVSIDKEREQVTLKVDESNNVRMRVARSSIVSIMGADAATISAKPATSTN